MQPSDEAVAGLALHARMLAGDRTASDDVFGRYAHLLVAYLKGFRARKDLFSAEDETLWDAAIDALTSYLEKPERYDPTRGKTLLGYLKMAAEGDLKNLLTARRPPKETKVVRLFEDERNIDPEDPRDEIADAEDRISDDAVHRAVADAAETDDERIVLALMLACERSNAVYAARLGWANPASADTGKRVNTIKDRLSKRLKRRYAGRMRDATAD